MNQLLAFPDLPFRRRSRSGKNTTHLDWFGLPAVGPGEMETHLETSTLRSTQPGHLMQIGQI
jgi:hypothetical protein